MTTPEEERYVPIILTCPECGHSFEGYAWDYPTRSPLCPKCNNVMEKNK